MIQLSHIYSTKELAEVLDISYGTFRNRKQDYENHLAKFYIYTKIIKGNTAYYTFEQELYPYIPYKEYKAMQKSSLLQKHIKQVIESDNRQTGSNVARIIVVNGEIQALDLKLSTLTVYVRDELKELVEQGYYIREDYRWCYLDNLNNKYVLMSDEEVARLRGLFNIQVVQEQEENIWSAEEQGSIQTEDAIIAIGTLRKANFIKGRRDFQAETGYWPIKVPVYVQTAFIEESNKVPFDFSNKI